jgi:hypothetical protein
MKSTALKVAGVLFLLVTILHVVRIFFRTVILVGGTEIPIIASIVGALISLASAGWMFFAAKQ